MRIRKIDLQGFKSFVDRQTFHMGDGIAGVVGPNGCGKSNIVDAIRWCIGEQSAKSLRGAAMQDVIFNGSAARKPVGMAEVALTFGASGEPFPGDWARFEELEIARRLYRDGTSEYLINQNRVRRKDIVDFFMDTGVGNKLYSFIQQGQIGEIVSARPEERRGMLEEAAGISKYKARREEAEANLASTGQNLERATDVAEEMGRRLRTLERQVEKATRFRRLRARIRQGELYLGLVKYASLSGERRELTGELREARDQAERLGRELERRDGDLRLRREEIAVMNSVVNTLRDQLSELEAQRRERESARHYHHREREEARTRLGVLEHDAESARADLERAAVEAERLSQDLAEARATLAEREQASQASQLSAEDLGRRLHSVRHQVEDHKRQVLDLMTGLARRRATLHSARQRKEEAEERLARFRAERGEASDDLGGLREALMAAEEGVAQAEDQLAEAQSAQRERQRDVQTADAAVNTARQAHRHREEAQTRAERELVRLDAQIQSLEDLRRGHAGVEGGARAVLKEVSALGTLAEHLDVPEALELPLSAALAGALDHVLLNSPDQVLPAARAAATAGRTGLILLSDTPAAPDGLAAQIGGTEAGRQALSRLLGDTRLTEDLASALAFHQDTGLPAVARTGEHVQHNGVVMVGRASASAGEAILRQRRKLAALAEERATAAAALDARRQEVDEASDEIEARAEAARLRRADLERAQARVREAELACSEARLLVRERTRELGAHEHRAQQLAIEEARLATQTQRFDAEIRELDTQIQVDEERQEQHEDQLRHAQAELVRLEADTTDARERHTRHAAERGVARERTLLLERSHGAAHAREQDAQRREDRARADLTQISARLTALESEQADIDQAIVQIAASQGETAQKLDAERTRLTRERAALEQLEEGLRGLRSANEQAQARAARAELRLQEVKLGIDAVREQLEGRYNVSLPGLLDHLDHEASLILEAGESADLPPGYRGEAPEPVPDLRITPELLLDEAMVKRQVTEVERLRAELDRLGEVNLAALEEFTEVAERYQWLEKQRADLEESVEAIRKTIARINKTCRERFRETFDRVNEHVQRIYPRLAGGGQARLSLTDEEDLLTTGVDIFVQPPGKRLQNLTLLSGGEKALCAIALIFALFQVKPSPFCLLDEVDAPLDEGNGARFNDMLQEMATLTQLIVITHNKKTMEAVDLLYGVTMPDPGVSRLVTVKVT